MELPIIIIDRFLLATFGTYGRVTSGNFACFSIERPWLGNAPWLSCIPAGLYLASRGEFSKGNPPYPDLEFHEVPGRTDIEVHAGTKPSDSAGCPLIVESLRNVGEEIHGFNSKHTLQLLLASFDTDDVHILIREG